MLLAVTVGLLFISNSVLSEVTLDLNYDKNLKESQGKKYDVRGVFTLSCTIKSDESGVSIKWVKEDQDINSIAAFKDRMTTSTEGDTHSFRVTKAREDDAGTYHCLAIKKGEEIRRANITLFSRYRVKTPDNLNAFEGDPMKIHCVVNGKPSPVISWKYENNTYTESTGRIILSKDTDKDVDNAILEIEVVELDDRGVYTCIGVPEVGEPVEHSTIVRVKDKYAALWPFLGICAEVFILCAIILIYEKKRNKTELEESDTDQSPDQKQTPDHGKESNLRHRQ